MNHHLIFEGAELVGKSWLISQIYNHLELHYNKEGHVLDGCHWLNCDVGVFGTKNGRFFLEKYTEILERMKNDNIILEKFFISDIVYNRINKKIELDYSDIEKRLLDLNVKIILCTVNNDKGLILNRIKDRLNLYPYYKRILKDPEWYLNQQKEYLNEIKKTKIPYLEIDMSEIPNQQHLKILEWMGEKT